MKDIRFETRFLKSDFDRPDFDGLSLKEINHMDKASLEAIFFGGRDQRSGLDVSWIYLKIRAGWDDFVRCIQGFHSGAVLSKSFISSFLTLVPKSSNPLGLDDYRPICLVGCVQLLDGVLVANELVDFAKKEDRGCLLFKVDFEKAYGKVSWNFLRFLLRKMGFGEDWLRWMEALIFSSKMSVIVNGSPTKEFIVERGLRQGDPISPFLFLIVGEGLRCMVSISVVNGDYEGFKFNGNCFVDILNLRMTLYLWVMVVGIIFRLLKRCRAVSRLSRDWVSIFTKVS
ncbi:uncharacterized protein LOC131648918 [Vicia villosa]|uniref:uncharacterized protein LOC131648918 n=1 Tax=Vicia villosa TaxID=3911 RepID=UPI00273B48E7|nr:uncharacterized protein LOC131648918 [Vicia villosa]